jgi:hypothetical protein
MAGRGFAEQIEEFHWRIGWLWDAQEGNTSQLHLRYCGWAWAARWLTRSAKRDNCRSYPTACR